MPLPPRKEVALRFQATTERILSVLGQANILMSKPELIRLFSNNPKRPHPVEREALLYRQALSYLREEWTGNTRLLSVSGTEVLMHVALPLTSAHISRAVRESSGELKRLISYIEAQTDHPVLIAGITHAVIARSPLHARSQGRMAFLMGSLVLTKYGYDCRGMLSQETAVIRDHKAYDHALSSIKSLGQMTIWLEYYTQATLEAYAVLLSRIGEAGSQKFGSITPLSMLNDRQKQICILLDMPGGKITNREVQHRFRISQITASRDLTKLVSAGFLHSGGKGRSIYYTLA